MALAGLKALSAAVLVPRLADEHPRVREHGRSAERNVGQRRARAVREAGDSCQRRRYSCAISIGLFARRVEGQRACQRSPRSRAATRAIRGCGWRYSARYRAARAKCWQSSRPTSNSPLPTPASASLRELARYIGRQNHRDEIARLLKALDEIAGSDAALPEPWCVDSVRGCRPMEARSTSGWLRSAAPARSES